MKTLCILFMCCLILFEFLAPVYPQSVQSRDYRPSPNKCDKHGRCSATEGYIEEVDDYKSEKERPLELSRDDWPIRPTNKDDYNNKRETGKGDTLKHVRPANEEGYGYGAKPTLDKGDDNGNAGRPAGGGYGSGYIPKPPVDRNEDFNPGIRPGGGGYKTKPTVDRDEDIKSVVRPTGGGGGNGGGYIPKPVVYRDDDIKPPVAPSGGGGGYGGGYNPKPVVYRDDDIKPPVTPSGGGGGYGRGYNPKHVADKDDDVKPPVRPSGGGGGYGGGYNPKPIVEKDDDIKPPVRPSGGGGGGYGGSHNPKPVVDKDEDIKPVRQSGGSGGGYGGVYNPKPGGNRGGYNPKPDDEDYDIKLARGGGSYYSNDDPKLNKDDLGGYNQSKEDNYNDYGTTDDETDGGNPIPVVVGNCICVPHFQCKDGYIITDGTGIIFPNKRTAPNEKSALDVLSKFPSCGLNHVCCKTPETSTVKPYEHRCGIRNPGGINKNRSPSNEGEADFGEWPWQAAVLKLYKKVDILQCGGVVIDQYHVLTAAHCVFDLHQLNEIPLVVRLGEWDTQATDEFLAHMDHRVSEIIIHPEYRNTSLWNNVAVLRLQDPVLFAPHIGTVCLPNYDEDFVEQNCVVTGWGTDAYKVGTLSIVMKEVELQVIDNNKCQEMLRKTRLGRFFELHEGFLCADGEKGRDSCKGGGGGPLVCYRKDKTYALAGIVSWHIECGQPGVPGVYVKIQKYLDWISETTGVTLQGYWPKQG